MDVIELTGFHGTSKLAAQSILTEGFKPSQKIYEWLGNGIYFFNNYEAADSWAKKSCIAPNNPATILQADLKILEDDWLDLDINTDFSNFQAFVTQYIQELKTLGIPLPEFKDKKDKYDKRIERCFWCNLYAEHYKIKMISYTFGGIESAESEFGFSTYFPNAQMCVFDSSIIMDVKEVSSDAI